jgi:very-short-patch-repair endonuclease
MNNFGIKILHFTNEQVLNEVETLLEQIKEEILSLSYVFMNRYFFFRGLKY